MNEAGLIAALGIVSACVAGQWWLIKFMFNKLLPLIEGNTKATASADKYLRQRNGRDIEHHTASLEAIKAIPVTLKKIADDQQKAIIKAVKVERQSVTEQKVEHQTVNRKD